jgi:hypothetical protein
LTVFLLRNATLCKHALKYARRSHLRTDSASAGENQQGRTGATVKHKRTIEYTNSKCGFSVSAGIMEGLSRGERRNRGTLGKRLREVYLPLKRLGDSTVGPTSPSHPSSAVFPRVSRGHCRSAVLSCA